MAIGDGSRAENDMLKFPSNLAGSLLHIRNWHSSVVPGINGSHIDVQKLTFTGSVQSLKVNYTLRNSDIQHARISVGVGYVQVYCIWLSVSHQLANFS